MVSVMDKWIVQDMMLPFLEKVPAREPGVLMAVLGIYHEVRTASVASAYLKMFKGKQKFGFDAELLARRILPFLLPLSVDSCLNSTQVDPLFQAKTNKRSSRISCG
jgi:SCY1-like protein 2